VDEMSWDDLNVGNYKWPSVDQVRKYRDLCRVVVDDLISSLPLSLPITWDQPFWVILVSLHDASGAPLHLFCLEISKLISFPFSFLDGLRARAHPP
jgi:hypothetical protein